MRLRARPGGLPAGAILGPLAVAGAALVSLLHLDHLPFSLCVFKAMTGWPCVGCGATRAVARLAALDVAGGLRMNPLAALGFLALMPWMAADLGLYLTSRRAVTLDLSDAEARAARWLVVVALALNWAYLVAVGR